jgi:hypothetical protein
MNPFDVAFLVLVALALVFRLGFRIGKRSIERPPAKHVGQKWTCPVCCENYEVERTGWENSDR